MNKQQLIFLVICLSFGLWMSVKAATSPEVEALNAQGQSLMQARSFGQAAEVFNRAVWMAPSDIVSRRALGLALLRSERYLEAARTYSDVCRMSGSDAMDHYWLGEAYLHANKKTEASEALADAVRMDPNLSIAHGKLAEAYFANKDLDKARQACTDGMNKTNDPQVKAQLASLLKICRPSNLNDMLNKIDTSVHEQPKGGFRK